MRTKGFHVWLSQADGLTPSQRHQAIDHLSQKQEPGELIGAVVGPHPPCPHCGQPLCCRWGNAHGLPRYRCGACGKTFYALIGPPLAHLRHRDCWSDFTPRR